MTDVIRDNNTDRQTGRMADRMIPPTIEQLAQNIAVILCNIVTLEICRFGAFNLYPLVISVGTKLRTIDGDC